MKTYEVREKSTSANPAEQGRLLITFTTYREAFRYWQQMNASGREVYVVRTEAL